jgi:hypothetical protein
VLAGMPLGKGNEVVLSAPEDQPYLPAHYTLPDGAGLKAVTCVLTLKRGLWLTGRVTDRSSGKPVEAGVRYSAAVGNIHLDDAPGFANLDYGNSDRGTRFTGEDGTYRLAVLPGPGLLTVRAMNGRDFCYEGAGFLKPNQSAFRPFPYGLGDAWDEVQISENAAAPRHDFSFTPDVARTIHGRIVDPEGKPLTGARYYGMFDIQYWYPMERTNQFVVAELRPRKPRTLARLFKIRELDELRTFLVPEDRRPVAIVHEGRHLAGFTEVGWNTPEPVQVRLQPWAAATARVVDGDGKPRGDFGIQPEIVLKARVRNNWISHWTDRIFTNASGNLRIEGLVPGLNYRLVYEDSSGSQTEQGIDLAPLNPGETRDLGDIKAEIQE